MREEKKKNGIKYGLAFKFIVGLVILGVCIMAAAAAIGVRTFWHSITRQYNEMAYQTAKTAEGYFTEEEMAQYAELTYRYNTGGASQEELEKVMETERYQEIKSQLDKLCASTNANDIFVFVFNMDVLKNYDKEADERDEWKPMYYICDSYHIEEEQFRMGDSSSIFQEYINDSVKAYETGVHADNYFISEGEYGYNTSAMYPVVQDGKTIAFYWLKQAMLFGIIVAAIAVSQIITRQVFVLNGIITFIVNGVVCEICFCLLALICCRGIRAQRRLEGIALGMLRKGIHKLAR